MPKTSKERTFDGGPTHPSAGALSLSVALLGLGLGGCGDEEMSRMLPPQQLAMTKDVAPIYDDGELTIYEVKRGIAFPIRAPTASRLAELNREAIEPYGRRPWITPDEVRVQLTWTLSNLDDEPHNVELLVDPWNEFGRYWPGLTLVDADDGEYQPNLSGIDYFYSLEGKSAGAASRRHGTYTFDDMEELARDFATVQTLIKFPPEGAPNGADFEGDFLPLYVNRAFHFQNHSERDPLLREHVPEVIAGLTGVDIGLRTYEPATIAVEVVVELVDTTANHNRVRESGSDVAILPPQENIVTVGVAP